jgi:hypothetical protein
LIAMNEKPIRADVSAREELSAVLRTLTCQHGPSPLWVLSPSCKPG